MTTKTTTTGARLSSATARALVLEAIRRLAEDSRRRGSIGRAAFVKLRKIFAELGYELIDTRTHK